MHHVKLIYNPGAGSAEDSLEKIADSIISHGYTCDASSIKEDWKKIRPETDLFVVAGGDGTVRKLANELIYHQPEYKRVPIAVLPLGTANNVATTLGLSGCDTERIISSWRGSSAVAFDAGFIKGLDDSNFFLEGLGVGVFPQLMKKMKKLAKEHKQQPTGDKLQTAHELLYSIISDYKACHCKIEIDGTDHSGKYLLAEVMNMGYIGANLYLAPGAVPDDGHFDVVLIAEEERELFCNYIHNKIRKTDPVFSFKIIKAKQVVLHCEDMPMHVDDERVKQAPNGPVIAELHEAVLPFLAPPYAFRENQGLVNF